ncbi:hypothetical protein BJF88_14955 [Cellulosimicrobium sp. CUA-896]|nr:hypothetical protein BJF88_14955 [Cellulosimicrobium sp. CUA-896]
MQERVGAERGHDALVPAVGGQACVVRERGLRGVGRREDLQPEALEQRARPVLGPGEAVDQVVVQQVGRLGGRRDGRVEHLHQRVLEPVARRRPAVQAPSGAEAAPDLPGVGLGRRRAVRRARQGGDAEAVDAADARGAVRRGALRDEHAHEVVVGRDEQLRGIAERGVVREERGVDVPVHGDDR